MIDSRPPTAARHPKAGETVVAVVVAYNRRGLLMETLGGLGSQSRPVDRILVVDNASTDGTAEAVERLYPMVTLISLARNTGGAGGFAAGTEHAVNELAADLVWLMDDDTVPDPDALEELLRVRRVAPPRTVLLASAVRWTDGRPHPMNTPRVRPFAARRSVARAERFGCYPVRTASFVSMLLEAAAVRRHGLPVAEYFLWNDDFEYSARLLRHGRGYVCTRSTVEHRTKTFGAANADPGPRFFWEVRNKIWLITRSAALGPVERPLYAVAAVGGWLGAVARSSRRSVLLRSLAKGVRASLVPPRSNSEVFSDLSDIARRMEAFERGEPV